MSKPHSLPPVGYLADQDRGTSMLAFVIVMQIFTVSSMALRFYSRLTAPIDRLNHRAKPRVWWDDWLALGAIPFVLANQYLLLTSIRLGLGKHIWNVPKGNLVPLMKINFAVYLIYTVSLSMTRQSALLFYARTFDLHHQPAWFKKGLYAVHAFSLVAALALMLTKVLICHHITDNWNPTYAGKCVESPVILLTSVSSNIAVDLCILLLPMPIIWHLQKLGTGRKIALTFVFICGYSTSLISVGRLVTIIQHDSSLSDLTYSNVPMLFWAVAECAMTTVSVCLPAMYSLGRRIMARDNTFTRSVRSVFRLRHDRMSGLSHTTWFTRVVSNDKEPMAIAIHDEGVGSEVSTRRLRTLDPYDIDEPTFVVSPVSSVQQK